nr:PREDICTED: meprin A subunit beta-like [Bemisia tabaci]
MRDIMRETCVRFKEWSGERDYVYIRRDYTEGAFYMNQGRQGGRQVLYVHQKVWTKKTFLHELGHVLNLHDEHKRPDRDYYIEVLEGNVKGELSQLMHKKEEEEVNLLGEPFDFDSIMMKGDRVHSKDPKNLITLRSKIAGRPLKSELNEKLSSGDVRRIRDLYRCYGAVQKPSFPEDVVCTFEEHNCGFKGLRNLDSEEFCLNRNRRLNWDWKRRIDSSHYIEEWNLEGYLFWRFNNDFNLTTTQDHAWSVGFYGLSPIDETRGPKGCIYFKYSFQTEGKGLNTLNLLQVELRSPLDSRYFDYSPKSSTVIWSETAERPRRFCSRRTRWKHAHFPLNVKNPFLLDFVSTLENGIGKFKVKIDDLVVQYTPCPIKKKNWHLFGFKSDEPIPVHTESPNRHQKKVQKKFSWRRLISKSFKSVRSRVTSISKSRSSSASIPRSTSSSSFISRWRSSIGSTSRSP